jgi:hypothetical protein
MHITDFKPFDIGGFTLTGWKDGERKIKLKHGESITFPPVITCNSVVYTLEDIIEFPHGNGKIFLNLEYS